ncbi:hypothetical protein OF83DRAFT_1293767 [Amylostereum chailletii]|nr:hypothetical protein OF83DRAFT_1293767 [Amylostereum chailletii]
MARTDKEKAAGISTSSFFDLQAELANKKDEIAKLKASGQSSVKRGSTKNPDKKVSRWAQQNKNVDKRAARDIQLEDVHKPTYESARIVLERKAKIYEKLMKGQTGGLTDAQFEGVLVDFDAKPDDPYESDSDDADESLTVPQELRQDDPVIEYEDEFGRVRSAPRSEVPRHLLPLNPQIGKEDPDDDDEIIAEGSSLVSPFSFVVPLIAMFTNSSSAENPHGYFPTYEPSVERLKALQAAAQEAEEGPLNVHYDASREVRAKGAGFYKLSGDEGTRRRQQEELMKLRADTQKMREETGAVNLRSGEVEGMRPEDGKDAVEATGVSRAGEKRKRDLEERRRKVEEARRKKAKGGNGEVIGAADGPASVARLPSSCLASRSSTPAAVPKQMIPSSRSAPPLDPFAALEAQAFSGIAQAEGVDRSHDVDAFLAGVRLEYGNER